MACKPICKLCKNLVISQAVTFTGGNLIINIPAGSYQNCGKYCIIVAQAIPATTTINAPVYITIGTGTVLYPLTKPNCVQTTVCSIRTRTRYSTCVITNATGATFRLLGQPCCSPNNALTSINGTTPVVAGGDAETPAVASFSLKEPTSSTTTKVPNKTTKTVTTTTKEVLANE